MSPSTPQSVRDNIKRLNGPVDPVIKQRIQARTPAEVETALLTNAALRTSVSIDKTRRQKVVLRNVPIAAQELIWRRLGVKNPPGTHRAYTRFRDVLAIVDFIIYNVPSEVLPDKWVNAREHLSEQSEEQEDWQ